MDTRVGGYFRLAVATTIPPVVILEVELAVDRREWRFENKKFYELNACLIYIDVVSTHNRIQSDHRLSDRVWSPIKGAGSNWLGIQYVKLHPSFLFRPNQNSIFFKVYFWYQSEPILSLMLISLLIQVVVVPWDYRIPKIRISTRQVDSLRDHRLVHNKTFFSTNGPP